MDTYEQFNYIMLLIVTGVMSIYLVAFLIAGSVIISELPSNCHISYQADHIFYTSNVIWLFTILLGMRLGQSKFGYYIYVTLIVSSIVMLITSMITTILTFTDDKCMLSFSIISVVEVYLMAICITFIGCVIFLSKHIMNFDV